MKFFLGSTALLSCEAVKVTSVRGKTKKIPRSWRNEDKSCLIAKETVSSGFDRMARFVSVH